MPSDLPSRAPKTSWRLRTIHANRAAVTRAVRTGRGRDVSISERRVHRRRSDSLLTDSPCPQPPSWHSSAGPNIVTTLPRILRLLSLPLQAPLGSDDPPAMRRVGIPSTWKRRTSLKKKITRPRTNLEERGHSRVPRAAVCGTLSKHRASWPVHADPRPSDAWRGARCELRRGAPDHHHRPSLPGLASGPGVDYAGSLLFPMGRPLLEKRGIEVEFIEGDFLKLTELASRPKIRRRAVHANS